jgi:LacI family transcriptional regulator
VATALKDIAWEAGVSVGTVSDILNRGRSSRYSPETCQRVIEVSIRRQYRPHRSAQAMRSNKTKVIGFAAANFSSTGQINNYPAYSFMVGLNHRLSMEDYHVGLVELAELEGSAQESALPQALHERFFDALVVHYGLSDRAARFAESMGLPLLWWDSGVFEPQGCLYRDEQEITRELMAQLAALGHRRIAFLAGEHGWQNYLAGESSHYSYAHRFETYRTIMQDRGMRAMPLTGYDPSALADQLRQWDATAVLILGSESIPLLEATYRLGWQIGRDLSVASLDLDPRLPSHDGGPGGMVYDRYQAGRQAAEMVLTMAGQADQACPSAIIQSHFEQGGTIGPTREHF